jgi:hypothetical protein
MPLAAPQFELTAGWQQRVLAAVGNYGAIVARHAPPAKAGADPGDAAAGAVVPDAGLLMPYVE